MGRGRVENVLAARAAFQIGAVPLNEGTDVNPQ